MDTKVQKRKIFIINVVYIAFVVGIIFLILKFGLPLVMPFIIALILVAIFNPLVRRLTAKLKVIKKEVLSFAILLIIYVLVGVLLFLLIMQLVSWGKQLWDWFDQYYATSLSPALDDAWATVLNLVNQLPSGIRNQILSLRDSLLSSTDSLLKSASVWGKNAATSVGGSVPRFLIAFVFTIMLSFFISLQYDRVIRFLHNQIPAKGQELWRDFRIIAKTTIGQYVKALLILMSITFVELTVGLLILGVPYAPIPAAGIAILDALPVFGTGTILIPWAIISLFQGNFKMAIGLVIIYGAISLVRNLIEPKVVGDKLGLNPIVSLVSIYAGYRLLGVFGMILMPIAIQVLLEFNRMGTIHLFQTGETELVPAGGNAIPTLEESSAEEREATEDSTEEK